MTWTANYDPTKHSGIKCFNCKLNPSDCYWDTGNIGYFFCKTCYKPMFAYIQLHYPEEFIEGFEQDDD